MITGAGSGLGIAVSKKLNALGVSLALCDINAGALQALAKELGGNSHYYTLNIAEEAEVTNVVAQIEKDFGKIDVLINSAGITGETNIKSHDVSTENLKKVFDVNFMGSYYTSKAVLPLMLKENYGRILHIASIAGKEGNAGMLAYSASKAAVIGMTKVQGKEYAETGITINALAPAVIRTPLVEAMPEAQVKYMTDKIPMKRCGTLEEVAEMVAWIVSPHCAFTTGFTFDLSGGRATY